MDFKDTPYWWEAATPPTMPQEAITATCDVAIIGAGFAGLTAALILCRAGRSVQVFDKQRPGEGASSRNGGITSGNIKMSFSSMVSAFGKDTAMAIYSEGVAAREDLCRFIKDEKIDCHYKLTGRFTGAYKPKHYDRLAREVDFLNKHLGLGAEVISRSSQHTEIGTDLYHGGVVRPDIGGLHPALLHQGILKRALGEGVKIHGLTEVQGFTKARKGFHVITSRGKTKASELLVCTNGYTGQATPWLQRRIIPIPSQIIATQTLPSDTIQRLMPKGRMLGETRNIYHYYRPSPDGSRIIFGGRAGADTNDPWKKLEHLHMNLLELFPELKPFHITHSWSGYTGYTFDFLPKSVVNDGVHYAAGFCGSGVVWARWFAKKSAMRIIGNSEESESAFDDRPFKKRLFYRGNPWFLPWVIAWYQWKDKLGLER